MSPARRLLIGVIVLLSAATGYAAGRAMFRPSERVVQPILFNHQAHVVEAEIGCETCHEYYSSGSHSGLPMLETCLGCHEEPMTESDEELKIGKLAEEGVEDPFRKLFRLADHTYYSHRIHVEVAKIECEVCHGGIARTTTPPERPMIRMTMAFCIDCHETSGASTQCTRCHH